MSSRQETEMEKFCKSKKETIKKMKIKAKIVADSKNDFGNRITTFILTYPRYIHSEVMTHRVFSRNAASSRAVPSEKLIKSVLDNPFIPIAFQKTHKGMQGTDYLNEEETKKAAELWLESRNKAVEQCNKLLDINVTKQLTNRLLEPFQYYEVIVTATEFSNFFALRCPQYDLGDNVIHRSRKDALKYIDDKKLDKFDGIFITELDWLKANKGQADIHIMALAEAMWDSINESAPKELKGGEWHIPGLTVIED